MCSSLHPYQPKTFFQSLIAISFYVRLWYYKGVSGESYGYVQGKGTASKKKYELAGLQSFRAEIRGGDRETQAVARNHDAEIKNGTFAEIICRNRCRNGLQK
jgi:hypothetical protein